MENLQKIEYARTMRTLGQLANETILGKATFKSIVMEELQSRKMSGSNMDIKAELGQSIVTQEIVDDKGALFELWEIPHEYSILVRSLH